MAEQGVAGVWRKIRAIYNIQGNQCKTCKTYYFPPRLVCRTCRRKGQLEPYRMKGLGKIYSFSIVRQAPENFKRQLPYVIAQVELDEGPRLLSTIRNIDISKIHCDMRVEVDWDKAPGSNRLPSFKVVDSRN